MNFQTHTPEGFANHRWHKMHERIDRNAHYEGIKVEVDRASFTEWIKEQWPIVEYYWIRGETPSIDRIDPAKNYKISNLRIISVTLNSLRGTLSRNAKRSLRLNREHPAKICAYCGKVFIRKKRKDGRSEAFVHYRVRKTCGLKCAFYLRKRDEDGKVI